MPHQPANRIEHRHQRVKHLLRRDSLMEYQHGLHHRQHDNPGDLLQHVQRLHQQDNLEDLLQPVNQATILVRQVHLIVEEVEVEEVLVAAVAAAAECAAAEEDN